jgi:hypothetical protein
MATIMLLSISFVACQGDDKEEDGYKITGQVENGNSNIATVKAIVDGYVLAKTDYSGGGFTIILPVPDKEYLEQINLGETVEACMLDGFYAYNSKNSRLGQLAYAAVPSNKEVDLAVFIYTTKDFEVNGTSDGIDFNVSCKKGWNILYSISYAPDYEIVEFTTQKPSGLRWLFLDDSSSSAPKQTGVFPAAQAVDELRSAIGKLPIENE